jgi:hypothetical protein
MLRFERRDEDTVFVKILAAEGGVEATFSFELGATGPILFSHLVWESVAGTRPRTVKSIKWIDPSASIEELGLPVTVEDKLLQHFSQNGDCTIARLLKMSDHDLLDVTLIRDKGIKDIDRTLASGVTAAGSSSREKGMRSQQATPPQPKDVERNVGQPSPGGRCNQRSHVRRDLRWHRPRADRRSRAMPGLERPWRSSSARSRAK